MEELSREVSGGRGGNRLEGKNDGKFRELGGGFVVVYSKVVATSPLLLLAGREAATLVRSGQVHPKQQIID